MAFAMEKYRLSERHACELNGLDRSTYRYEPEPDRNVELRANLTELARQRPRFGYRRLGVLLERDGEVVNHKRLLRVYQQAGLAVRHGSGSGSARGQRGQLEPYPAKGSRVCYPSRPNGGEPRNNRFREVNP